VYGICVVGLGYVGIPTACAFASKGTKTVGVDIKSEVVNMLNKGSSFIREPDIIQTIKKTVKEKKLVATTDINHAVQNSKAIIIAVQTPVENATIELKYLHKACEDVAGAVKEGTLVIIESTVPPGTCSKLVRPIFERRGFRDGKSFFLAYCPERIAPGNSLTEFLNNDRIIGYDEPASGKKAIELFTKVTEGEIHTTDIITAETVKLVENTARDVYIAFANEVSRICSNIGIDAWEVIKLANTHPRVKILKPGPGVGGPCLTKDPYMLLQNYKDDNSRENSIIKYARLINDSMYQDVLKLIHSGFSKEFKGKKIAILGTAYKPEVSDARSSPSEKVIRALIDEGFEVWAYDPFCEETFGAKKAKDLVEAINGASCCVFMVGHNEFSGIELGQLAKNMSERKFIVDATGVLPVKDGKYDNNIMVLRLGGKSAHGII